VQGRPFKLTANERNQAVQAFWAMHVETLNRSGMTLTHDPAAAKLSKSNLRLWRDLSTHPTSAVLSDAWYFAKRVTLSLALRSSGDAGRGFGRVGAAAALVAG
jgi:hypothetical protein